MVLSGVLADLLALRKPLGDRSLTLRIGPFDFLLEGLESRLEASLRDRWGSYASPGSRGAPRLVVRLLEGRSGMWLPPWRPSERYRTEATFEDGALMVRSYHFAMCPDTSGDTAGGLSIWRAAVATEPAEPAERVVENALRHLIARVAVDAGGMALQGGGVLEGGSAYMFVGPSRSGKTTAVELSAPRASLGDDLAMLLPEGGGWSAAAIPFMSCEIPPTAPPGTLCPVAGVFRLFPAEADRVESLDALKSTASMMACVAFPWALPDLAGPLLEHVRRFIETGRFAHLYFRKSPEFWSLVTSRR
jgi:hypothetical protein